MGIAPKGSNALPIGVQTGNVLTMKRLVVIATKGRARETGVLFDYLARQSVPVDRLVGVGTEPSDLEGLDGHDLVRNGPGVLVYSDRAGLPIQRNVGIEFLAREGAFDEGAEPCLVAFFDDDFRPAETWMDAAADVFLTQPDVVGVTGHVLADGVTIGGISEEDAAKYVSGALPPRPHWASGSQRRFKAMYGCNMAFRDVVFRNCRFDERLPLYAWQEDRDFTGQAAKLGDCIFHPALKGVHLGVTGGRGSGVRLGYSQIANMAYLLKKGTADLPSGAYQISRNLASNTLRSYRNHPMVDYRGRLKGNLMAIGDVLRGKFRPERILEL